MAKLWGRPPSIHSCKRLRLDEPWHGNVLLSCGPHKLEPKQRLQEFNADFVPCTGCWFVFVDAPGNLICGQTVCAALVATSARTLEERRSGGLKEFSKPERQTVLHALRCSRTIRG